jgi:hypothetical protein
MRYIPKSRDNDAILDIFGSDFEENLLGSSIVSTCVNGISSVLSLIPGY